MKTVVTAGALDTKGADYEFLVRSVRSHDVHAGGVELSTLRQSKDKTLAMRVMAEGLSRILSRLHEEGRLDGVCGMGGNPAATVESKSRQVSRRNQ
jgi:uncharacterized protein (UPF0261 family)